MPLSGCAKPMRPPAPAWPNEPGPSIGLTTGRQLVAEAVGLGAGPASLAISPAARGASVRRCRAFSIAVSAEQPHAVHFADQRGVELAPASAASAMALPAGSSAARSARLVFSCAIAASAETAQRVRKARVSRSFMSQPAGDQQLRPCLHAEPGVLAECGATARLLGLRQADPEVDPERPGDLLGDEPADAPPVDAPDQLGGQRAEGDGVVHDARGPAARAGPSPPAPARGASGRRARPAPARLGSKFIRPPVWLRIWRTRDRRLAAAGELGPVARHRGVEVDQPAVGEDVHDARHHALGARHQDRDRVLAVGAVVGRGPSRPRGRPPARRSGRRRAARRPRPPAARPGTPRAPPRSPRPRFPRRGRSAGRSCAQLRSEPRTARSSAACRVTPALAGTADRRSARG